MNTEIAALPEKPLDASEQNEINALKLHLISKISTTKNLKALKKIARQLGAYEEPDTEKEQTLVKEDEPAGYAVKSPSSYEELLNIASKFPKNKRWNYAELENHFPANLKLKVEILNARLFIMPSPSFIHQQISNELSFLMTGFVKQHRLGRVVCAPMDTKLDEENIQQPDILFISVARYEIIGENCIEGAPDLVVEIMSPGNKKKEREAKHKLYESKGVGEYWTIFPQKRQVKVEILQEGKYKVFSEAQKNGSLRSSILPGLEIELEDILHPSLFDKKEKKK